MPMLRIRSLAIATIVILAAPVGAGCGSDGDNGDGGQAAAPSSTATRTTAQPPAAERATIRMTEFAFEPNDAIAEGGERAPDHRSERRQRPPRPAAP